MITVQAVINNVTKTFTLNNLSSVRGRQDLGQGGVEDMTSDDLDLDLNEASVLWNLRIRYDNEDVYTYVGAGMLVSVNPYRYKGFLLDSRKTYAFFCFCLLEKRYNCDILPILLLYSFGNSGLLIF